ncbi:MAG: hypothetical protein U5K36_03600 [Roseovarius sp.]|nr:hypothetical protein [Roseovarius sp.]
MSLRSANEASGIAMTTPDLLAPLAALEALRQGWKTLYPHG